MFTMDVEPVTTDNTRVSGPKSNKEGEICVKNYISAIGEYGYTPTFFIHPELGKVQSDFFLELQSKGACLGLHLHTTKFIKKKYDCEMGGLSGEQQREILEIAIELYKRYFGFRPELFRPGVFSANDYTYKLLHELGFKGGNISVPGRIWPDKCAIWSGAYPYPHFAHPNFRQIPGDLPFVEIPLSVDFTQPLQLHPLGFWHYFDLRPGDIYSKNNLAPRDHRLILKNIVQQLATDNPALKTIVIDTHNDFEYLDRSQESAQHLHTVLEEIEPELKNYGLKPVNATFNDALQKFLKIKMGEDL